jgi:hypothetical protein
MERDPAHPGKFLVDETQTLNFTIRKFLRESDRAARRVADSPAPQNLYWLGRAIACLEEVLKWIPDGEERPPAWAFFTEDGLRFSREESGRFRRSRLLAVLAAYQEQRALARTQLG